MQNERDRERHGDIEGERITPERKRKRVHTRPAPSKAKRTMPKKVENVLKQKGVAEPVPLPTQRIPLEGRKKRKK